MMVFVRKNPKKAQKRRSVIWVNSFRILPSNDTLKNIERAENDFVILPEKICAFHREPPSVRANCCAGGRQSPHIGFYLSFGHNRVFHPTAPIALSTLSAGSVFVRTSIKGGVA
jgi:hypothetical protein